MKGLTKKEAMRWGSLRLTGRKKKQFTAHKKTTDQTTTTVVRCANGIQLLLIKNIV